MNKGFTIIETLVAITILIIGVLGPLSLAARGISDGLFAQNQLTANLLAQEAVETFVNLRNERVSSLDAVTRATPFDFTSDIKFSDKIPGSASAIKTIGVDSTNGTLVSDCPVDGCRLKYSEAKKIYENTTGLDGMFSRQITAELLNRKTNGDPLDELKVTVTISWFNKTVPQSFTTVEYLYGL